jgi:hypothetical protein
MLAPGLWLIVDAAGRAAITGELLFLLLPFAFIILPRKPLSLRIRATGQANGGLRARQGGRT